MTQKLTDEVVVQLNDLPGFPARPNTTPPAPDRWILGDWLVECHVNPEAPDFASLPLTDNRVGDVRVSLADQAWFIWDGAVWQPMAGGGGGVASVGATLPLVSSGGVNPVISITTAGAAAGDVLTYNGAAWAAAAAPVTPAAGGLGDVQLNDGANGFTASTDLSFNALVLTVTNRVDVTDGANILTLTKDAVTTDAATLTVGSPTAAVNISGAFTLPTTDGSSGDVLTTDGAGTVSWAAPSSGAGTVDIPTTAQEALNAGDLVRFTNDAGTPRVQKADATNADARLNPIGFAVAAAGIGAAVTVRIAGVADVPAARFDAAPGVANVGQRVWCSTTSGQITLTAPSASGDIVQRVGVLVDGSANPKVLVQIGDPVLL